MDSNGLIQGKFILMNDIDLSAYDNWLVEFQDIIATGFAFSGTFDGNGYSIKNLKMDGGNTCQTIGFLGALFQAEIKNLGFENVDIKTQREYVGAIAGWSMDSVVSNCYVTGTVQGSTDTNMLTRVGGLVGANGGIIDSCYSEATVSGNSNVGGLVGVNGWQTSIPTLPDGTPIVATNCSITNSFATGNVTGRTSVGGLIGSVSDSISNISNVYATGNVTGDNSVGGLVGHNRNGAIISNTFATGQVTITWGSLAGGLLGSNDNGGIQNSIWNTDTTGQTNSVGGSTGVESNLKGLTTSEMQDPSNWSGWDTSIWDFSTYPPTFKMYSPIDSPANPGGGTGGGTDPSNPGGGGNTPPITPEGSIRLQIGADSTGTSVIYVDTSFDLGAFDVDFSSADSCAQAIDDIDSVLEQINTKRAEFGAAINRLNSILESQTTTIQNYTAAKSTIMDADIATESADFVKSQILQQTSSALLAQSQNIHSSIVLSLIQ